MHYRQSNSMIRNMADMLRFFFSINDLFHSCVPTRDVISSRSEGILPLVIFPLYNFLSIKLEFEIYNPPDLFKFEIVSTFIYLLGFLCSTGFNSVPFVSFYTSCSMYSILYEIIYTKYFKV